MVFHLIRTGEIVAGGVVIELRTGLRGLLLTVPGTEVVPHFMRHGVTGEDRTHGTGIECITLKPFHRIPITTVKCTCPQRFIAEKRTENAIVAPVIFFTAGSFLQRSVINRLDRKGKGVGGGLRVFKFGIGNSNLHDARHGIVNNLGGGNFCTIE